MFLFLLLKLSDDLLTEDQVQNFYRILTSQFNYKKISEIKALINQYYKEPTILLASLVFDDASDFLKRKERIDKEMVKYIMDIVKKNKFVIN